MSTPSASTAPAAAGASKAVKNPVVSKIDVKLVAPFVSSVQSVFQMMANVEITVLRPYVKSGNNKNEFNVFGIIGFSGELTGAVTVSFTHESADKLVEVFVGSKCEPTSPNFADAIGELANMIAGSAKSKLGLSARITVPSVIIGDSCHVATLSDVPCVVIPCSSELGDFAVEVCIKQQKA